MAAMSRALIILVLHYFLGLRTVQRSTCLETEGMILLRRFATEAEQRAFGFAHNSEEITKTKLRSDNVNRTNDQTNACRDMKRDPIYNSR